MTKILFNLFSACVFLSFGITGVSEAQTSKSKLLKQVDSLAQKVAKHRGLAILKKIRRGMMTKSQLKKRILKRMNEEYSPKEFRAQELFLKSLRLIPTDADLKSMMTKLLLDQVAGFYDPFEKKLYLADYQISTDGQENEINALISHEITHALQDQHFKIKRFLLGNKENTDRAIAGKALVEGDAMALMTEISLPSKPWGTPSFVKTMVRGIESSMKDGVLGQAPLAIRRALLFPYLRGLAFVAYFLKENLWDRIDEIYSRPPATTEQVLHPEKYVAKEKAHRIRARKLRNLKGRKLILKDTFGEFQWNVFLLHHGIEKQKADNAAAGWGGDRLHLYEGRKGRTTVVAFTSWDQEGDAVEFYETLKEVVDKISGKYSVIDASSSNDRKSYALTKNGKTTGVALRGSSVLFLVDVPKKQYQQTVKEMWKSWKVKP